MKSNKKVKGIGKYGITMSMMFLSLLLFTLYFTALGSLTASGSDYNQCISVEVLAGDTVWEIARDINRTYLNQKKTYDLLYLQFHKKIN